VRDVLEERPPEHPQVPGLLALALRRPQVRGCGQDDLLMLAVADEEGAPVGTGATVRGKGQELPVRRAGPGEVEHEGSAAQLGPPEAQCVLDGVTRRRRR
jgi:hypothetical protein